MSENEDVQLLSMDLNTIETKLPIIVSGIYECRITKSEIQQSENQSKSPAWKLTLETTAPVQSVPSAEGKVVTVEPGHPLFMQTQLRPTGKSTMKMVVQNIAQIVQGLRPRIDGTISMPIDPWYKQAEGRMVRVRVLALPAQDNPKVPGQTFRARNQVDEVFAN